MNVLLELLVVRLERPHVPTLKADILAHVTLDTPAMASLAVVRISSFINNIIILILIIYFRRQ